MTIGLKESYSIFVVLTSINFFLFIILSLFFT